MCTIIPLFKTSLTNVCMYTLAWTRSNMHDSVKFFCNIFQTYVQNKPLGNILMYCRGKGDRHLNLHITWSQECLTNIDSLGYFMSKQFKTYLHGTMHIAHIIHCAVCSEWDTITLSCISMTMLTDKCLTKKTGLYFSFGYQDATKHSFTAIWLTLSVSWPGATDCCPSSGCGLQPCVAVSFPTLWNAPEPSSYRVPLTPWCRPPVWRTEASCYRPERPTWCC